MQNNKINNQKEEELKKVYVLQYAHEDNGFDAEYLVFTTLDDAEYKADDLIEEYCKDYTDEEKDEVDGWRSWDYSNGKDDEWFVRIDEAILYEEDEDTISEESVKTEIATVAQPDPLEDVDDLPTTVIININEIGYNAEDGDDLYECITNYLSDIYGYCIYGYNTEDLDTITGNIIVTNIEWDTKE